jgi:hypothetical protein
VAPSPDGHSKLDPLHALGGHGLCFLFVPAPHGFRLLRHAYAGHC